MTEWVLTDAVDVSLCDRTYRSRKYHNDIDKTVLDQTREGEPPEELMSQLEPYVGDARARLTVSGALSSNVEYHKAEAFVSVSVSCNNDMDDVQQVHDFLRPYVQGLIDEDHREMSLIRDTVLPPEHRVHGNEISPPVRKATPKGEGYSQVRPEVAKVGKPPRRGAKVTPGGKKPKPSMRR